MPLRLSFQTNEAESIQFSDLRKPDLQHGCNVNTPITHHLQQNYSAVTLLIETCHLGLIGASGALKSCKFCTLSTWEKQGISYTVRSSLKQIIDILCSYASFMPPGQSRPVSQLEGSLKRYTLRISWVLSLNNQPRMHGKQRQSRTLALVNFPGFLILTLDHMISVS